MHSWTACPICTLVSPFDTRKENGSYFFLSSGYQILAFFLFLQQFVCTCQKWHTDNVGEWMISSFLWYSLISYISDVSHPCFVPFLSISKLLSWMNVIYHYVCCIYIHHLIPLPVLVPLVYQRVEQQNLVYKLNHTSLVYISKGVKATAFTCTGGIWLWQVTISLFVFYESSTSSYG